MRLKLRRDLGGYALPALVASGIDGTVLEKPFTLLCGPNGSGKSAVLGAIRSSIGLRGDRAGSTETPMERQVDPADADGDLGVLAACSDGRDGRRAASHVPAVFDAADLGWRGGPTHLFDARASSGVGSSGQFGEDMAFEASMIIGGGRKASHGQFVSTAWWNAVEWALGLVQGRDPWAGVRPEGARGQLLRAIVGDAPPSDERWLLIDEPETAIDAETLLAGLSVLIAAAEAGRLRVLCASHSLLFAAGLSDHPKVQTIDMGGNVSWTRTQKLALQAASMPSRVDDIGAHLTGRLRERAASHGRTYR